MSCVEARSSRFGTDHDQRSAFSPFSEGVLGVNLAHAGCFPALLGVSPKGHFQRQAEPPLAKPSPHAVVAACTNFFVVTTTHCRSGIARIRRSPNRRHSTPASSSPLGHPVAGTYATAQHARPTHRRRRARPMPAQRHGGADTGNAEISAKRNRAGGAQRNGIFRDLPLAKAIFRRYIAPTLRPTATDRQPPGRKRDGEVVEWSIAPHSKCGVPVRVPWVRIPPSPP